MEVLGEKKREDRGLGFVFWVRAWGLGFGGSGFEFWDWGLGFGVWGVGFRIEGLGFTPEEALGLGRERLDCRRRLAWSSIPRI